MSNIFEFIREGLEHFSDNGGLYDTSIRDCCIRLNELLNNVSIENYEVHLNENENEIEFAIKELFFKLKNKNTYDLEDFFFLLKKLDESGEKLTEDYRDHNLHSIQCFLLSISFLSKKIDIINDSLVEIFSNLNILFFLMVYHDIGYIHQSNKLNLNTLIIDYFENNNYYSDRKLRQYLTIEPNFSDTEESKFIKKLIKQLWTDEVTDDEYRYIITNINTYTGSNLPPVPEYACHLFRCKVATHSG